MVPLLNFIARGAYIKDNKAAKSTKIKKIDAVKRYKELTKEQHQRSSQKRTPSLMSYKKQHLNRLREGNEVPQTLHQENGSGF